ncbi:MAG: zinc-ribbon domain-containing protein [Candidatus Nealsonbacteria bacterium]
MTEKTFTISVEKIELEEKDWPTKFKDIKIESLKMYHKECNGGEMTASEITEGRLGFLDHGKPAEYLALCCNGCKKRIWIKANSNPKETIIKTAIDGKKREMITHGYKGSIFPGYNPKRLQEELERSLLDCCGWRDVYVIQKGSEDFYCPFCGSQLIPTVAYCPNCGTEIENRIAEIKEVKNNK